MGELVLWSSRALPGRKLPTNNKVPIKTVELGELPSWLRARISPPSTPIGDTEDDGRQLSLRLGARDVTRDPPHPWTPGAGTHLSPVDTERSGT